MIMEYEAVIGLEVHLHLNTKTKAFCACSTEFGKEPNSQTCPVCLGFPGSLPVFNKQVLGHAIKVGLAFNCDIQEYTKFDRKHYYYPDLPKNYQISQYDLPLCRNGHLDITVEDKVKRIGIRRVHMEEDAGKLIHEDTMSLVDYNRAGVPLLEIVTEPDINSSSQAYEYLMSLKSIIAYLDVSDCDMEKGSLRCDANISLRQAGAKELGVKAELKNMNSFKAVKEALDYEIKRQSQLLDSGSIVSQETRLWDPKGLRTITMRTKEEAMDYRYFPEPDLPPFIIERSKIEELKKTIPELPEEKKLRFMREYGLSEYDAKILIATKADALYSEECLHAYKDSDKKMVVNWLIGPLLSEANVRNCGLLDLNITPGSLIELINLLQRQEISNLSAKAVLADMIETGTPALQIIKEKNLAQISDSDSLSAIVDQVIQENSRSVNDFKAGKNNAVMFLVGQVMKKSQGKANPKTAQDIIKRRLSNA